MRKWIIFRAEKRQPGWQERKLQHSQSFTKILAEHFDSSDQELPKPGDRLLEFISIEKFTNPEYPGEKTHYRESDWEVTKVESYTPEVPLGEFDTIVVCYCCYHPIDTTLEPMPKRQISLDSFADQESYQEWLESQKPKQLVRV